jgi:hypothetical protein
VNNPTEYILLSIESAGVTRALAEKILAAHDTTKRTQVLREAATALHTECGLHSDRQLFSSGIHHSEFLVRGMADQAAEEATAEAATATPTEPTGRVAQLLEAIRTHRGEWTTKRVQDLYRLSPLAPPNAPDGRLRHVARGDLRDLCAWGHLVLHEESGRRFYTLKFRKDATS